MTLQQKLKYYYTINKTYQSDIKIQVHFTFVQP